MLDIVISDTSCLILLNNIGAIDLLQKLYNKITTTTEVAEEFGDYLPNWIVIKAAKDKHYQKILELQIDRGEASAIALAIEFETCTLIVDDNKARKVAKSLGLNITGTIGIIVKAKLNGVIPSIKPYLVKIQETNFRISESLIKEALLKAEE